MTALAEADAGYGVALGGMTLTPTAGLRWLRVDSGSYTETGSSENLSVAAASQDQVETSLGAKIAYPVDTPVGRVIPEVKAAWLHDLINGNVATTAQLGGASFATDTALPTADGAEIGAGLTLAATDTLSVRAEYDGQFRQDYSEHTGMIEVRTRF
ncbi:MAG: autotransporter outer membrane beta-barrel domain-containing protein [Magnetospirillum sp.]|nr:autotransporter outer membrane beta-barrel domain-containing protein [Magnetospirillum sp.]